MANNKSLPKLSHRREFQTLSQQGQRTHINSWLLFNYKKNDDGYLRCGWTIPRYVGNAVTRNRIRRWCREFFSSKRREHWDPNIDLNVVVRKREKKFFKELSHQEFKEQLEKGVRKLAKSIQ